MVIMAPEEATALDLALVKDATLTVYNKKDMSPPQSKRLLSAKTGCLLCSLPPGLVTNMGTQDPGACFATWRLWATEHNTQHPQELDWHLHLPRFKEHEALLFSIVNLILFSSIKFTLQMSLLVLVDHLSDYGTKEAMANLFAERTLAVTPEGLESECLDDREYGRP
ncbi:hypothetical protein Y1Q_0001916 [Alligator mississippiensis]|uniref:Uncharacterized protein n=1 Tax=Alligator mississippiensis TaxID=8496 RepID=A0A151PG87_ALLMI|nr:hypothetical protein Y1Q_0001916 [Alligator mississippiensis]